MSAMEANEGTFIHFSSVFISNGRADTPSQSVLVSSRFRVPAFDQRQHDLCGCATCVGRLVFVARGRPLSQEKPLDKLCCCLSAGTNACMMLAMEAREGLDTEDQTERLKESTGHLFEEMMANYQRPAEVPRISTRRTTGSWVSPCTKWEDSPMVPRPCSPPFLRLMVLKPWSPPHRKCLWCLRLVLMLCSTPSHRCCRPATCNQCHSRWRCSSWAKALVRTCAATLEVLIHLILLARWLANHPTPVVVPSTLQETRCGTSQAECSSARNAFALYWPRRHVRV